MGWVKVIFNQYQQKRKKSENKLFQ